MFKKINAAIESLRNKMSPKTKLRQSFYIIICALFSLYVFALPSFNARGNLRFIAFSFLGLLALFIALNYLLFQSIKFNRITLLFAVFIVISFIGTLLYSKQFRSFLSIVLLAISFFVLYIACLYIKNKNLLQILVIASFSLFALYFIIVYRNDIINFKDVGVDGLRLGSYFDNVNEIAIYMSLAFSNAIYLILFNKKKLYLLMIIPALLFCFVGVTTGSRSFIVTTASSVLLLIFFRFKHKWFILLPIVGGLIIAFIIMLQIPFMNTIKERIVETFKLFFTGSDGSISNSTIERMNWMFCGIDYGTQSMFFGYGANGFRYISGITAYSHSNLAEMLCNFGFVGFFIYYIFTFYPLAVVLPKNNCNEKYIVIIFSVLLILLSFTTVYFSTKIIYVYIAIYYSFINDYSLIQGYKALIKNKKNNNQYQAITYKEIQI